MSTLTDANMGTTSVRPEHLFNEDALVRWMTGNVEGFVGPVKVEQFKGGQSNPTLSVVR